MKKVLKWIGLGFVGLVILSVAAGGSKGSNSSSSSSSSSSASKATADTSSAATKSEKSSEKKSHACSSQATDDCTPHVGPNNTVRVDALRWRVEDVSTTTNIGANEFDNGTDADGTFVIVKLKVHSYRNESADLIGVDDLVSLKIGSRKISPSTDGEVAYSIANDNAATLSSLDQISPDADKNVTAVFDVPNSKLSDEIQARFGELGFGQTEGFIRLRSLTA